MFSPSSAGASVSKDLAYFFVCRDKIGIALHRFGTCIFGKPAFYFRSHGGGRARAVSGSSLPANANCTSEYLTPPLFSAF